jgi:hypothetical protein
VRYMEYIKGDRVQTILCAAEESTQAVLATTDSEVIGLVNSIELDHEHLFVVSKMWMDDLTLFTIASKTVGEKAFFLLDHAILGMHGPVTDEELGIS